MLQARKSILVTGAAGKVGRILCPMLSEYYELRQLDITPLDAPQTIIADIKEQKSLDRALENVDAVIHLAGDARKDADFESLLKLNIAGTYHVYEAARRNGVRRVVMAGSNHSVEHHSPLLNIPVWKETEADPVSLPLSCKVPPRPDSLYGASKAFGEVLARYYADTYGITSVCLRLGSVTPEPAFLAKPRAWALWISHRDLLQLFRCAIEAEGIGCAVVYGCSANTRRWWDLSSARELIGFVPVDDSESLISQWYKDGPVPPAPRYPLPWGERLAALPVSGGHAMLVWIGQSGFFLKLSDGSSLAIDPFLTVWPDRLEAPLLPAEELPVDLVLVSHTHRDHLDVHALPVIAQSRPHSRFIAPPSGCEKLLQLGIEKRRIHTLRPNESYEFGEATVTAVPARHEATAPDAQGYVIRTGQGTLYHTGDTEYDPCLMAARTLRPDFLLVPINGRKGNMTAEQAAQLASDLKVSCVIPMHYGCLQPQSNLLERFLEERARVAPDVTAGVMELGSILQLAKVS